MSSSSSHRTACNCCAAYIPKDTAAIRHTHRQRLVEEVPNAFRKPCMLESNVQGVANRECIRSGGWVGRRAFNLGEVELGYIATGVGVLTTATCFFTLNENPVLVRAKTHLCSVACTDVAGDGAYVIGAVLL